MNYNPDQIRAALDEMARLNTESSNPRSETLSELSTSAILALINDEDATVPATVNAAVPMLTNVVEAAVGAIQSGGRLVYVGAGTSGRLGVLDAAECPPTYGVPATMVIGIIAGGDSALKVAAEGAEDDEQQAMVDLEAHGVNAKDAVLGITARGQTPYVRAILREAKRRGAWAGLLTCNAVEHDPDLDALVVLDVGPEVVTGSTRMKAGLATKMALTMISTATMVRLGRVEGNRMVRLMPNSTKLKARQVKLLMETKGVTLEEAAERLEVAGGDLTRALAM
ncbi:N-acetylmuramic acid 6-phosphate etherase [bacterium]|nr:N-acetylmuramic acid 6-phosphate etherase [bacterium]